MHWGVMTVHCQECNPSNEVFLSLFSAILYDICYLTFNMPVGGLLYCHVQSCTAVRSPEGESTAAVSTKAVISQKTSLLNVLAELCLTMPSRCTYASSRRILPECQIQSSMIGPVQCNIIERVRTRNTALP